MISRLAELPFCLVEPVADGAAPILCGYPGELDLTPESQFLKSRGWQQRLRCITDNTRVIRNLIRSRQVAGVLPRYMCGELLADRRLKITPLPKRRDVWLLVQNHLRRDAAARAVIDWIRASFREFAPD
jgi:DNA-binding transcriptional LysR family regulator